MDVPPISGVKIFSLSGDGPRYVTPSSALTLLRCHSRVEVLIINLDNNERKRPELRVQLRTDFALDLSTTLCPALQRLNLSYRYEDHSDHSDQRFANEDVRSSHEGSRADAFSTSLRQFLIAAPNLETVNLGGPVCID
jgi:hypothetical protein